LAIVATVAEQTSEHTIIQAPVERCFAALTDFESYPEWAADLKEVAVLERDADDRAVVVEFRAAAMGRSTTYRLRYDYTDAPSKLGWMLDEGDIQRELDGAYHLEPAEDDPASTHVIYELSIDLIMPIPGFIKRRAEARILKTALDQLKTRVEGAAGATA
jgi:uncharacterized protein YndB with AHSA1/START domain